MCAFKLDDNGILMCNYSIFNIKYMFDYNFTAHVFKHINEFCSLSTHRTEMKEKRELRPRCSDVEILLNLYLYIFKKIEYI